MDYIIINFEYLVNQKCNYYLKDKRQYNTFNNRLQTYDTHAITTS